MLERLRELYAVAVAAAQPRGRMGAVPQPAAGGRLLVLGAGKAAASMAVACEEAWGERIDAGLVVTSYGNVLPAERIEVMEASHPVPDGNSLRAAERILELARGAQAEDTVVFLASGGGSALMTLPAPGLDLEGKQALTKALLASGAPITEINNVRKSLSAIKGGRLAQACAPARVVTYVISDMPGEDATLVASGPTLASAQSFDPLEVLDRWNIGLGAAAREAIAANPAPPPHAGAEHHLLACARDSLAAAASQAQAWDWDSQILGDDIEGEAREVAQRMGIEAKAMQEGLQRPALLLSGGETTVAVRGKGRGGRNQEFCLALALALASQPGIHAIAADTDGIDGSTKNAGALVAPDSLERMRAAGINPQECLQDNDAERAFAAIDGLLVTGPSLTNVNDFRALLIEPLP